MLAEAAAVILGAKQSTSGPGVLSEPWIITINSDEPRQPIKVDYCCQYVYNGHISSCSHIWHQYDMHSCLNRKVHVSLTKLI